MPDHLKPSATTQQRADTDTEEQKEKLAQQGVSTPEPAEGADDAPPPNEGSPKG